MINRTLIRLKVVQLVYAYYQNEGKTLPAAEKELLFSLGKAYELYHLLLLLPVGVTEYARRQVERLHELTQATHAETPVSFNFVNNKFVKQLSENVQLSEYKEEHKCTWDNEIAYLRNLYDRIVGADFYQEYIGKGETSYEEDRELWRCIFKQIVMKDELLDDVLEDLSLYWNDDRGIVDSFVLKTIKSFAQEEGDAQELLPDFKDSEDKEFAVRLFHQTITNAEYYQDLIYGFSKNWDASRMAYMDVIIMQIAIAEMLSFPMIPLTVTMNEYVEIAKYYSTPKSFKYINGLIDAIAHKLKDEHKLMKN